ncbi:SDR family NAD(P)-dependent oxidoreductase [Chitinophaga sedimenti]|nr:SDR family NAD(P)-dependent oxidoreductase [Chitinophaga sedimenti]
MNVFGTINIIRQVLPYMRAAKAGHIINIASIAGITANTGWAIYGAAKYAVMGLSEVLAADVKDFNIKVTAVAPGAFRTSFLTDESLVLAQHIIPEYEAIRASHDRYKQMNGLQDGDPEKAAAAMIELTTLPDPPTVLLLGEDAYKRANDKIAALGQQFRTWEALTRSTAHLKS